MPCFHFHLRTQGALYPDPDGSECRNLADIAQLQQQWLADTARRSASDLGSMARDSLALTCRVAARDRLGARSQPSPIRNGARAKSGDEAPVQRAAAE